MKYKSTDLPHVCAYLAVLRIQIRSFSVLRIRIRERLVNSLTALTALLAVNGVSLLLTVPVPLIIASYIKKGHFIISMKINEIGSYLFLVFVRYIKHSVLFY